MKKLEDKNLTDDFSFEYCVLIDDRKSGSNLYVAAFISIILHLALAFLVITNGSFDNKKPDSKNEMEPIAALFIEPNTMPDDLEPVRSQESAQNEPPQVESSAQKNGEARV